MKLNKFDIEVSLALEHFEQLQRDLEEDAFKRGKLRGYNDLLFLLHRILVTGELSREMVVRDQMVPDQWAMLEEILDSCGKGESGAKAVGDS